MSVKITKSTSPIDSETPSILYKYRMWSDSYHKTILTKKAIYHARPTSFEDKKDCKNLKRYDLLTPLDIYNKYYNAAKQNQGWDELDCRRYATEWFHISD